MVAAGGWIVVRGTQQCRPGGGICLLDIPHYACFQNAIYPAINSSDDYSTEGELERDKNGFLLSILDLFICSRTQCPFQNFHCPPAKKLS